MLKGAVKNHEEDCFDLEFHFEESNPSILRIYKNQKHTSLTTSLDKLLVSELLLEGKNGAMLSDSLDKTFVARKYNK